MSSVLVPLAEGFEEIEAITIIDVLRRAGVTVHTAGLTGKQVRGAHGVTLAADKLLDEVTAQRFDMIVLPGGLPGAHHLRDDARVRRLLREAAADGRYVAAICAAPVALAAADLLDGKAATSYPGCLETLDVPGLKFSTEAVVQDGKMITSRGPATAMAFALYLIKVLKGDVSAKQIGQDLLFS